MARQRMLMKLTACDLLILSMFLSGVSSEIDNQAPPPSVAATNQIAYADQQQRQPPEQPGQRLPMPGPTVDWTEMTDELPPPIMPIGLRISKRAPNGFIGMRGKKEMDAGEHDAAASPPPPWLWGNVPLSLLPAVESASNAARYKKSPSAFYGVRGKKYGAGSELTRLNLMLRQLEQEQLREQLLQELIDRVANSAAQDNEIVSNEKRAPIGFAGVRGKRPNSDATGNNSNKHFNGLNSIVGSNELQDGNADYEDDDNHAGNGNNSADDDDVSLMLNKRGPSNAFMGVRGKKSLDHQHYKRSPNEAYSGGLRSGGKQQRFVDFGNKFVAVRGKKDSNISGGGGGSGGSIRGALGGWGGGAVRAQLWRGAYELPRDWYGVLPAAALASLTSSELLYNEADKRAPNGFVGMRGKRAAPDGAANEAAADAAPNTPANIQTGVAADTKQTPLKMLDIPKLNM